MNVLYDVDLEGNALRAVHLHGLMQQSLGNPDFLVGMIDGPVDLTHPAFETAQIRTVRPDHSAMCLNTGSGECSHGTAVAGILCASRHSPAPAICPGCTILVYPIFSEDSSKSRDHHATTPEELSRAIRETVDAGCRLINLSLGVITSEITIYRELDEACEYASKRGALLVAAAGNQGRIGYLPLFRHLWILPVAACDGNGRIMPESNLGPTIGSRGVCAPGSNITTAIPGGKYAAVSGTSAAAAIVSGALALLWSECPSATANDIRRIALESASGTRRSIVPPLFNAETARQLSRNITKQKEILMADDKKQETSPSHPVPPVAVLPSEAKRMSAARTAPNTSLRSHLIPDRVRVAAQVGTDTSCPTCAAAGQTGGPLNHIFAIGTIRMEFPSPAIEKEFLQTAANGQTANLSDKQVRYNTLREARYLANEVCWVLSIENTDAYILVPRDTRMLDQFVEATAPTTRGLDVDVVIGTRGPIAPPEMCNGLLVPMVFVDQSYSFNRPDLINAIKKPEQLTMSEEDFRSAADELFGRIQQLADNVGATDEHRALNYLAVRYQQIYTHTTEMFGREFSLTGVEVVPSRLSANRKLVDVIFTYTNRSTDVMEKYYVRLDVTEKYPFLDKKLSPYYDRQ